MTAHDARMAPTQSPARRRRVWPWVVAIACVVVGWYLWRATSLWYTRPVIAFDLVEFINERKPKPGPEGSAFPIYREAFGDGVKARSDQSSRARDFEWRAAVDPAALAGLRKQMDAAAPRVAVLRGLSAHPVLGVHVFRDANDHPEIASLVGYPIDAESRSKWPEDSFMRSSLSIAFPAYGLSHQASSLLLADAALAALDRDFDRAIADLDAASTAAAHAGEYGLRFALTGQGQIECRVAMSIVSMVENHAESLSDAQLEALERVVRRLANMNDERMIEMERQCLLDSVQRLYSDDGAGNGELLPRAMQDFEYAMTPVGRAGKPQLNQDWYRSDAALFAFTPITNRWRDDRAMTVQLIDRILGFAREGSTTPSGEALRTINRRIDRIIESAPKWEQPIVGDFGMGWTFQFLATRNARLSRDAALAAVGIERFRRVNARFPESLDELNAFVGMTLGADNPPSNPWRYAIFDGRPLIYDFGWDGIDDGARPAAAWISQVLGEDAAQRMQGAASATCGNLGSWIDLLAELDPAMRAASVTPQAPTPTEVASAALRTVNPAKAQNDSRAIGDTVWVLWRSGAVGSSRVVRLKPDNGEFDAAREDG
jgi:hypothetical protein